MSTAAISPESFQTFGDLLKYLRRREHLTQLELSISVGYSEAQISRLEQNQRLPDLAALKALFIPALHLENEPKLTARILQLAQVARQEEAPVPGVAPYKGLLFFDRADSDMFFGREVLTAHLADRVTDLATEASSRFLAIVGASGSGKSSLLRAGLAMALQRAGWEIHIFTPTVHPLKILAANYDPSSPRGNTFRLVIVDQFEETFTHCRDDRERSAFIETLLSIARDPVVRTTVVIALRADFYPRCAQYPLLREAVADKQEYIGQMTKTDLRRAMEEPARRGGWEFEPGLVEILLNDVGADEMGQPEPGALPLLSHALLATWERRRGRTLTIQGYRASGGVHGAIAETAESVFTDQLDGRQQDLARDIFLRLTELGEGTEDTRRRAALNELVRQSEEAGHLRAVLNTLAEARLITLNEDSAEVAHEALIREWQRLREWLTRDREALRLHRHLTNSAHEWEARGRDPAELYRGARLAQMREWAVTSEGKLNASERAFLEASTQREQHEALEREAQRQRELQAAQELAATESRAAAQLRRGATFLTGALILAILLAAVALFLGNQANRNAVSAQQYAREAQLNAQQAELQRRIATARELAAASLSNLDVDPERSILLALQAVAATYRVNSTVQPQAEDALHRAIMSSRVVLTPSGHMLSLSAAKYSPDGTRIVTAGQDGIAKVWDARTGQELITLQDAGPGDAINGFAYHPDGTRVATANDDGTVKVWEAATGREVMTLTGHNDYVMNVAYSPDGTRLAASSGDGTILLWNTANGKELLRIPHSGGGAIAFSPDGRRFAMSLDDNDVSVLDTVTGNELIRLSGHTAGVNCIEFSPDDTRMATVSDDSTARVWDATTGMQQLLLNLSGAGLAVAFSPDGKRLATSGFDGIPAVWDASSGKLLLTLYGHASAVYGVSFSPDGTRLVTAGRDTTARVWDLTPSHELLTFMATDPGGSAANVVYSPNGERLATTGHDHVAKVWDARSGRLVLTLSGHSSNVNGVVFSPDGSKLATVSDDMTAKIWDANSGKELFTLVGHAGPVIGAAFNADGTRLATASQDKTAKIWDVTTGKELRTLSGHTKVLTGIAYSPNGKYLVTISADHTAILWDPFSGRQFSTITTPQRRPSTVAVSPDGHELVVGFVDGTARVFQVNPDSMQLNELYTLSGHSGMIEAASFGPDGERLATASDDNTAKIWDTASGQVILTLVGPRGGVRGVAFNPDGTRLATAAGDGTVRVYLLRIEDLIGLARSRVTRPLTDQECQQYLHVASCPALP